jgi:hypothetical protein
MYSLYTNIVKIELMFEWNQQFSAKASTEFLEEIISRPPYHTVNGWEASRLECWDA